jgi:hypothetical protein
MGAKYSDSGRRIYTGRGGNMRIVGLAELRKKMTAAGDRAMAECMNTMLGGMKEAADMAATAERARGKGTGEYADSLHAKMVDPDTNTGAGGFKSKLFLGRKLKASVGIFGKWTGWFVEYGTFRTRAFPHIRHAVRRVWKRSLREALENMVKEVSKP